MCIRTGAEMSRYVQIVGAGIGGLSAAIALAQQGFEVAVFEQADVLTEAGAGLQLSPNAMKILNQFGLGSAIAAVSFEPENGTIRNGVSGKTYLQIPLKALCRSKYGAPYFNIHRADLQDALVGKARDCGVVLNLGQTVVGFTDSGELLMDEVGRKSDIIVAADGIRSAIGGQMHPQIAPRFTGQVAWRGTVAATGLPRDLIPKDATVWVGKGRHIVTYFLRGGDLVNFVAVEERDNWQDPGWKHQGDPAELRAAFQGWNPAIETLLSAVDQTYLWALFDRPVLPFWFDGPAVLLGDACHPTLPFMAQGAAMAIEDAAVLAQCLADSRKTVSEAFRVYEKLRKLRTKMLQARARENAALFHLTGPVGGIIARAKLLAAGQLPSSFSLLPVNKVYGYDVAKLRF
jgi:salicylate hydroxylase